MSHIFGHLIRPIVGGLGHATKEVRWHRSYDDANNRADRTPYYEKIINSLHVLKGVHEHETDQGKEP
jgi:hypothetical protein